MNIRVIVFDDNKSRREGLRMLIDVSGNMECVGIFSDCRNVVQRLEETNPDVVLMDIDMPHVDGLEGVRRIREVDSDLKIIMQTVFEDNERIFEAICAGADGYILKQKSPIQLIEGIQEVMEGGAPMTPVIARKVLKLFSSKNTYTKKLDFDLTKREQQVLELLVQGNSYKMIADQCHIAYATVNTHIAHIYEKLQVHSVAGAVSLAIREGLV